jgi:trans-aconitate 2-methyltransferase
VAWDPAQYHKFTAERFAPFDDLFALISVREGLRVVDLGCGTGELTRRLADRLPGGTVLGIDSSSAMLERAQGEARPGLAFSLGTIEEAQGEWDLVFSHAALHWVGDHRALIPRLMGLVSPGGQLAVQIPANHHHPAHTAITDIAREKPFVDALGGWVRLSPVLEIDTYAELLFAAGGEGITVLEKVYPALMPDAEDVAEWTRGTTLVPYFERLPGELHEPFLARYRERLHAIWPQGPVFYTFRRIVFTATKAAR